MAPRSIATGCVYFAVALLLSSIVLICFSSFSNAINEKGKTAIVVFYNVENLFDTLNDPLTNDDAFTPDGKNGWNTNRYKDKINKISSAIRGIDDLYPTMIGLCEVENKAVLKDLTSSASLKLGNYEIIHFDGPDKRGIDVALLYAKKKFKPSYREAIRINLPDSARSTRDILYVKGRLRNGPELHIFVNHWPSRHGGVKSSEHKRIAAANSLRKQIDSLQTVDPGVHIICMGDFNDYPENNSIAETLGKGKEQTSLPLCNLMKYPSKALRGSYNYRGQWGFLDQIIVSCSLQNSELPNVLDRATAAHYTPEMIYTNKNGEDYPNRTYGGSNYYGGFSDHLPVYTVLAY